MSFKIGWTNWHLSKSSLELEVTSVSTFNLHIHYFTDQSVIYTSDCIQEENTITVDSQIDWWNNWLTDWHDSLSREGNASPDPEMSIIITFFNLVLAASQHWWRWWWIKDPINKTIPFVAIQHHNSGEF